MQAIHSNLASGRWHTMRLAEQLGNVGSEYERALQGKDRGDTVRFENAFTRMLELLDLTITDPRWKNHRLRELVRLREVVCEELVGEIEPPKDLPNLRNYFLYFGILARSGK